MEKSFYVTLNNTFYLKKLISSREKYMYFLALPGTMGLKHVLDYNKYMYIYMRQYDYNDLNFS